MTITFALVTTALLESVIRPVSDAFVDCAAIPATDSSSAAKTAKLRNRQPRKVHSVPNAERSPGFLGSSRIESIRPGPRTTYTSTVKPPIDAREALFRSFRMCRGPKFRSCSLYEVTEQSPRFAENTSHRVAGGRSGKKLLDNLSSVIVSYNSERRGVH